MSRLAWAKRRLQNSLGPGFPGEALVRLLGRKARLTLVWWHRSGWHKLCLWEMRFWEESLRRTGRNNLVAGCALQFNRELSALPIKEEIIYNITVFLWVALNL